MTSPIEELFSRALGLEEPWQVVKIEFSEADQEINIYLDFPPACARSTCLRATLHRQAADRRGSRFRCPKCGRKDVSAYDTREKRWRHLNFFQHQAYLHCPMARVDCPDCGIKSVELPWARSGSGFTLLFEALIMTLAREMTVSACLSRWDGRQALARLINEHDTRICLSACDAQAGRVIQHYVSEARKKEVYHDVDKVAIDETSRKRGHHYVTLFVDLDQSKVIFATEGKDSRSTCLRADTHRQIGRFSNDFHDHGGDPDDVREVCCDMSPAFIDGVEQCLPVRRTQTGLPNAQITFDRFHVMKIMADAVDKVRRQEQQECKELKRSRYIWLKNPENLTVKQSHQLEQLSQRNLKTVRAYQIRLNLREFWDQPPSQPVCVRRTGRAEDYLKRWYFWATHSRLEPIKEVAYTIKRHWDGVVNFVKSKITNGVLEGINSLVQAARNKARGYRSVEYFITMIYMIAGKLKFGLPI